MSIGSRCRATFASSATTRPTPGGLACGSRGAPQRIAADLHRLRALNANTVRVVLARQLLRLPGAGGDDIRSACASLVGIAARSGLRVQLTLFDWWGDYRDIEGSKQWARADARAVRRRSTDRVRRAQERDRPTDADAVAWTRELVPWLRDLLRKQTPVTVSVAGMRPVRDLRALVAALPARARPDFFDAHTSRAAASWRSRSSPGFATSRRRHRCGSASSATRPRRLTPAFRVSR